jgi:PAS domain S-box-containing protein
MPPPPRPPRTVPIRVAGIYAAVSLLWIWFSDTALARLGGGDLGYWVSTVKGSLFVLASAGLVYALVRRDLRDLSRATTLLRAVADGSTDVMFVKDRDGKYLFVNAAAAGFVGRTVAQVLGQDDTAFFPPDEAKRIRDRDREVMASGRAETREEQLTPGGVRRTYLVMKAPYRDAAGAVVGVVGVSREITGRKAAEEDLERERTLLRTLLDTIPDKIFTKDAAGRFVLSNRGHAETVGAASDTALVGKTVFDLHPRHLAEQYHADDQRVLRDGESIFDREELIRNANGRDEWHHMIKTPLRDRDGRVVGLVGIGRNIQELKARQRALEGSEASLARAQRIAHVGDWEQDLTADRLRWSAEVYRIFGREPEGRDLRQEDFFRRVHPDDAAAVKAAVAAAVADKRTYSLDHRIVRADGEVRFVHESAEPVYDAAGRPVALVGTVQDITDRKKAERALRESEDRYRRLLDVLPTAVFVNTGGRIVFCNPAVCRLFGAADPAEVLGKTPFDLFHPDCHDLIRERIDRMKRTGEPVPGVDKKIVRRDGRTVPVHVVATPVRDRGEISLIVALYDLTERERSTGLLRSVMESVTDPIITATEAGVVVSANQATRRVFGYGPTEIVGRNVRVLLPDPRLTALTDCLGGADREFVAARKDGATFPVELTVTEFQTDGDRHVTAVVRDITARKRLEEQFRQAQKMEAVGRLAGGVAHDFNNMLTVINGYSDLLLIAMPSKDTNRASIAAIRDAGERAAGLTAQLLAFSRKTVVQPKVLDLNEVITASERLLRRLIGEDVVLTTALAPALGRIKADPTQVEQVVMNLAVNARDAMPTGGRLTIETRNAAVGGPAADDPLEPGAYVLLSVSDTGSGMTEDVKANIFEPFFTTKGPGKGTGLGLSVVYGIVTQCGGQIKIESAVGAGTTFHVWLPAVGGSEGLPAAATHHAVARGSETVLLVEDEDAVRTIARIALESQGYAVIAADSGSAAVRLAEEHRGRIDLLVSDVIMPELSGRELAEQLRATQPGLRILFMSGYTDDAVVRHGVIDGRDAFIQKPFSPLGLAKKVRAVLDGGR